MRHQLLKYVWLLKTIKDNPGICRQRLSKYWTTSDIGDGLKIPKSTFFDWRNYVEDLFGVKIKCKFNGSENGYYVESSPYNQSGIEDWLISTLSIHALISDVHQLRERIQLERTPSGEDYLLPIIEAMKSNVRTKIQYQKFGEAQPSLKTIEPYCVKVSERRWYVLAKDIEKKELRTYALDRIQDIVVTTHKFRLPRTFSAINHFKDSYGIYGGKDYKPVNIRIRVYGQTRDYLRTLPIHDSQKEVLTTQDYAEFTLYMSIAYDLKQNILSFGPDVEILEPQTLRQDIKSKIKKMRALYETDRVGEVIPSPHS